MKQPSDSNQPQRNASYEGLNRLNHVDHVVNSSIVTSTMNNQRTPRNEELQMFSNSDA
jgi:hypothetical protein